MAAAVELAAGIPGGHGIHPNQMERRHVRGGNPRRRTRRDHKTEEREMTKLFASILVALAASAWLPCPAAHADGQCTGLAHDAQAYSTCRINSHLNCVGAGSIGFQVASFTHVTCTYPDGGRDECDETFSPPWNSTPTNVDCRYVPPGA